MYSVLRMGPLKCGARDLESNVVLLESHTARPGLSPNLTAATMRLGMAKSWGTTLIVIACHPRGKEIDVLCTNREGPSTLRNIRALGSCWPVTAPNRDLLWYGGSSGRQPRRITDACRARVHPDSGRHGSRLMSLCRSWVVLRARGDARSLHKTPGEAFSGWCGDTSVDINQRKSSVHEWRATQYISRSEPACRATTGN